MQPNKLSKLSHRFAPALVALAVVLPLVGCGKEDAPESTTAPTNPPMLQQQSPEPAPQGTDLDAIGAQAPATPQTPEVPEPQSPEPLVTIDPYRALEQSIAELPNIHLAELYFDLNADALERAEDIDDYTGDRLVVWLVVQDLGLLIPNPDSSGETLLVLHTLPDATKDQIMQLVTEAFPDAESVDIFVDQESSRALAEEHESVDDLPTP